MVDPADLGGGTGRTSTIRPEAMEFSADGRSLAVASGDSGEIVILDARHPGRAADLELARPGSLYAMSFSPDGRLLIAGGDFGTADVVDTATWEPGRRCRSAAASLIQIEWLRDDGPRSSAAGTGRSRCSTPSGGSFVPAACPAPWPPGRLRTFVIPDDGRGTRRPQ